MTKKITSPRKKNAPPKKKMTTEERRAKYTALARQRRDAKLSKERARDITCYNCRRKGHVSRDCPNTNTTTGENNVCCCYKCGSVEHTLSTCPKMQLGGGETRSLTDLPYATCFVCGEKGHLASQCQQNEQGIYVNGGCCRTCGSTKHFAVDCPKTKELKLLRTKEEESTEEEVALLANQVFLEGCHGDEQPEQKNQAPKVHKKRRVVKF